MCMCIHIQSYIHTYIHTYRQTYRHTYIQTNIHYITLHYITLHCIALHYMTSHHITSHHITLHTSVQSDTSNIHPCTTIAHNTNWLIDSNWGYKIWSKSWNVNDVANNDSNNQGLLMGNSIFWDLYNPKSASRPWPGDYSSIWGCSLYALDLTWGISCIS